MNPNTITLSCPAYGASAAATYSFVTKGYKPAMEDRYIEVDVVKNQNGKFKYIYDNGPGFRKWEPFSIACEQAFGNLLGATAGAQYENLRRFWEYPGLLGMQVPDGIFSVHWGDGGLEKNFRVFPRQTGDLIEYEVIVQFEEG